MFDHRTSPIWLITLTAIVLALGPLGSTAYGQNVTAGFCKVRPSGGEADFGSGTHSFGLPDFARVNWTFQLGTTVTPTATVVGTLYVDRLFGGQGCARLKANFQDNNFNNLAEHEFDFCGTGGNANDPANKRVIPPEEPGEDLFTFTHPQLRRVQLVVGSGTRLTNIIDENVDSCFVPAVNVGIQINNGVADLGGGTAHAFGSPVNDASISLTLGDDGRIHGRARGTLFADTFFEECALALIDFEDPDGVNLRTPTPRVPECGAPGGNALHPDNQDPFDFSHANGRLFQIRVRVAQATGSPLAFSGPVVTRIRGFGPTVGTVETFPGNAVFPAREKRDYGIQWTVPDPASWRSLDVLEVRLVDEAGEALRVHWDEATNIFTQLDSAGRPVNAGLPGTRVRFKGRGVTLFLNDSEVIGSGPTGPSVLFNLNLRFKQRARWHTFAVEALALNDSGHEQGWENAGTIRVLPRSAGHRLDRHDDGEDDEDED